MCLLGIISHQHTDCFCETKATPHDSSGMQRERGRMGVCDAMEEDHGHNRQHHRLSTSPVAVRRRDSTSPVAVRRREHSGDLEASHEHLAARAAGLPGVIGDAADAADAAGEAEARNRASAAAGLAQLTLAEQNFPQLGEFGFAPEPARAAGASPAKSVLVGHHNFPQLGEFGFGEDSTSGAMCGSPAMSVGGGRTAGYCAAHYPSLQT